VRYEDLPASLLGSPGAMGRFRRRPAPPAAAVTVEPWALFAFLSGAVALLLAIGWLRRLIGDLF
jgi:hypothetical protein